MYAISAGSHPLGVRELKLRTEEYKVDEKWSHPLGVRELKPIVWVFWGCKSPSHPLGVRELKLQDCYRILLQDSRTL